MKDNVCRIVKVDKEAIFEFIYEEFIAHHDHMLDIPATTTSLLSPGKSIKTTILTNCEIQ